MRALKRSGLLLAFCGLVQCGHSGESSTGTIQGGGASAGASGSSSGGSDAGSSTAGAAGLGGASGGEAAGTSGQGGGGSSGAGGQLIGNEDLESCANSPAVKEDGVCHNAYTCIENGCPEGESCCFAHCIRGCRDSFEHGLCIYLEQNASYFTTGCVPAKDCSPDGTIPPPPLDFCDPNP